MQQQPVSRNPSQVVVLHQPAVIDKQSSYMNVKQGSVLQLIILGILQILIGILCIIFQVIHLWVYSRYPYAVGIEHVVPIFWSGVVFIVTGIFAITGGIQKHRCLVAALIVLSILSACFAAILASISVRSALSYANGDYSHCIYNGTAGYGMIPDEGTIKDTSSASGGVDPSDDDESSNSGGVKCSILGMELDKTGTAVQGSNAILGLLEIIFAIWKAVVCCTIGACCCDCGGYCLCCPRSTSENQLAMTEQLSADQSSPGQQQIIITKEKLSTSSLQPQTFIFNQTQTFLPNSQNPNIIITSDPRKQTVQPDPLTTRQLANI